MKLSLNAAFFCIFLIPQSLRAMDHDGTEPCRYSANLGILAEKLGRNTSNISLNHLAEYRYAKSQAKITQLFVKTAVAVGIYQAPMPTQTWISGNDGNWDGGKEMAKNAAHWTRNYNNDDLVTKLDNERSFSSILLERLSQSQGNQTIKNKGWFWDSNTYYTRIKGTATKALSPQTNDVNNFIDLGSVESSPFEIEMDNMFLKKREYFTSSRHFSAGVRH